MFLSFQRPCSVFSLSFYLIDLSLLHLHPQPGNLLRTTDGRLCILDHGMTLNVPNDLQYALLEFIAHINVEDYDAIIKAFSIRINIVPVLLNAGPEYKSLRRRVGEV